MKLEISRPAGPATDTLTITPAGAYLWQTSSKGTRFKSGNVPATVTLGELPLTVWVEVTQTSGALRDVSIELDYKGQKDVVKATGVWATLSSAAYETKDAAVLFAEPEWAETTTPPKDRIQLYEGVGLRPILPEGVKNVILIKYNLLPSGIGYQPNVSFDIARQAEGRIWVKKQQFTPYEEQEGYRKDFPAQDEGVNDDDPNAEGQDIDESSTPTGTATTPNYFFVMDAVGPTNAPPDGGYAVLRSNFREFVRVSFDGQRSSGNIIDGSRCSDKFEWRSRMRVVRQQLPPPNPPFIWKRSQPDDTNHNSIGPGNVPLGVAPQQ